MTKQEQKHTLICWHSKNNGVPVLLNCLEKLASQEKIEVGKVYYLQSEDFDETVLASLDICNEGETKRQPNDERGHIKEVKDFFYEHDDFPFPRFQQKRMHLTKVTDYESIYGGIRAWLGEIKDELAQGQVHINVSPGTPQMQTVWLILNSAGYLPPNTRLWSSQKDRKRDRHTLEEIQFKPKHQLSNLFELQYQRKHPEEVVVDTSKTSASKRKEAETLIGIFTSASDAPILLLGERGTGKSTYVKQLIYHKFYKPKNLAYRHLPCGLFSSELMRSELFGHVKGAFTGAIKDKKGILEEVGNNGLLFLDEIHDLDKPLQRQLMLVLQTGEYTPIGYEGAPKKANFRLATASNLPLRELRKKLDHDFFDRIAAHIVEVPSIRDSKEDYNIYWKSIWEKKYPEQKLIWNQQIEKWLYTRNFPNNFRGLEQVMGYFIAFLHGGNSNWKQAWEQATAYYDRWQQQKEEEQAETSYFRKGQSFHEIMANVEYDLANWAKSTYGSIENAAGILDIGVSTLRGYLAKNRLKRNKN